MPIIDWVNFTPINSLLGGVFIGLAAAILLLANGRIMGISGILGDIILFKEKDQISWRIVFVIGVLIGPFLYLMIFQTIKSEMVADRILLIQAGLLVGLGTSIGSGCTSGHGICGISRLSIRSIVATFIFVVSGVVTVYFIGG
tara:strand:+ start:157 stop:585 length:429 start_codon:yes stop_codon:yes gene_type:complete